RLLSSTPRSWRMLAPTPAGALAGTGRNPHAREPPELWPRAVAPLLLGLALRFDLTDAGGRIPIAAVPLAVLLVALHCRGLGVVFRFHLAEAGGRIPIAAVPLAVLPGPLLRVVRGLR